MNLVVPSPCETEPYNKSFYNLKWGFVYICHQLLINWPLWRDYFGSLEHAFSGCLHCGEVAVVGRWPLLAVQCLYEHC